VAFNLEFVTGWGMKACPGLYVLFCGARSFALLSCSKVDLDSREAEVPKMNTAIA
jgi:hypothetical protein